MATIGLKANEQRLSDDFDDLNFDSFNYDVVEPQDDRHPVMKVIKPIGRGARDYITNSSNIEKFVKAALPKGYGQAYDLANDTAGELKQLYNSAAEEIKPVKETARKLIGKALPSLDGKIPKGLKEKLENFSKGEEQFQARQGDAREEQLGNLLSGIFEQKAKDEVRGRNEANEREKIRQGFEQIRHRDHISQLDAIRIAVESQAQYQNRVTFNVQKKQLELSYRMFWAMADLNKEQKRSNAEMLTELKATKINTGLPDYVKTTTKERFVELSRNKFLDSAREKMFGGVQNYLKNFASNLGQQALGTIRGVSSTVSGIGGMADSMDGMGDMPGMNMKDEIISALMQFPMDYLAEKGSKQANAYLGKNRNLRRGGSRAEYFAATAGDRLKERLTSNEHQWSLGEGKLGSTKVGQWGSEKLEGLRRFFAGALPSSVGDTKMDVDSIGNRHEARPFSRANSKSIDEVIPGLLARIHREIKILRTGDESTPLLTYDFTKNKFSTDKQIAADLRTRLSGNNTAGVRRYAEGLLDKLDPEKKLPSWAREEKLKELMEQTSKGQSVTHRHADEILKKVDRAGKMTPEQRELAKKMLIEKSVKGQSIDITNVSKAEHWGGGANGEAIAERFNRFLRAKDGKLSDNDQSYRRQMDLINTHKSLSGSIGDPRAFLQQMVNAGQLEQLQQMGILNDKNEVDLDVFTKWIAGEEIASSPVPSPKAAPVQPPITTATTSIETQRQIRRMKKPAVRQALPARTGLRKPAPTLSQIAPQSNDMSMVHRHGEEMVNELRSLSEALRGRPEPAIKSESTVEKNVQSIADILGALDQKYEYASESNHQTLSLMLEQLSQIAAKDFGGGSDFELEGPPRPNTTSRVKRAYSSLWEHVKASSGELFDKTKRHARIAKRRGIRLWDKHSPALEQHARTTVNYIGNKFSDMSGKLSSYYGDVVVNGEMFPRLRAHMLKAGEYRDKATGRVITSLEDITGDVVDASGNVVITMEEFYNSYVTGSVNKRVKELFSKAKSRLEDWKTRLQDYLPEAGKRLRARLTGALETVKGLMPPYDVYVKTDMKRPLLYANVMRYEMYFSQRTGKAIKHPRDIDGPVIDHEGNVVVSEEHLKQGLVDVSGDPVGNGLGRIVRKVARKAGQAWEMMRDAAVGIFGSLSKGLGNVGEYFKNFFAPFTDMITNSRKTVTLLEKIHDLLDNRLPGGKKVRGDLDGDGVRDGSIEDIRNKREREQAGVEGGGDAAAGARSGGGISKLMAGITSLFNRKKNDSEEEDEDEDDGLGLEDAADMAEIYDAANGDGGGDGDGKDAKKRRKAAKKRLKRMKSRGNSGFFKRVGERAKGAARWGAFNTDIVKGAGNAAATVAKPVGKAGAWVGGKALSAGAATGAGLMGDSKLAKAARWGMFNTDIVRGMGKAAVGTAKYAPRVLGAAGAAYGAYSAYDNFQQGNYGMAALDAGLTGAGVATTVGGMAGLAGYGGAVLGGLGTILASPFLIPAGIAAGVAGAGYLGYKWLKKTKVTNLSKIRLAQYGIDSEDKDGVEKMFGLEALLEPLATLKEDGNLYLDEKKLDTKEIAELFEIHREQDMQIFNLWYRRRFVPVFRAWLTELRKVDKGAELGRIEGTIPPKDKLRVAESVVNAHVQSYSHMVGWNSGRPKLVIDHQGVKHVLDSVRAALMKEREADGGEKATVENRSTVASTTAEATVLAQKALTDKANYTVKDKDGKTVDTTGMEFGDLTEKIKKGEAIVSVAVIVPKNLLHNDKNTLDALTSIRYKAYGLTHMTADKARTLSALEMVLGDNLTADTDNSKLTIATERIQQVAAEIFGIPNQTGEHANRWKNWFNGRFLPVFLLWAGTIRKKTRKAKLLEAHRTFPLADQGALARAIIGAQGINEQGGRGPVWEILSNPWADAYQLNSNPDSTAGNVEAIRQLTDKVRLGEVNGKPNATNRQHDKTKSDHGDGWNNANRGSISKMHNTSGKGVNATGDRIVAGGDKNAAPLAGMGDGLRFTGISGGNYTDLPTPSGAGWTANRELLLKAAAMAGVDPKALITTIAVESSFDPNAAPKNPRLKSTAKGLGQHLDSSWMEDLHLHGRKFGIPNGTTQFDARASALMTASRLRYNGEILQKNLGRQVTVTDLYLAHLMGLAGATKFLQAPQDAVGAEVAVSTGKQHPEYFYEGGKALTVKEVYAKIAQKLAKRPAEFGVTESDMKSKADPAAASTTTATSTSAPATGGATTPQQGNTPAIAGTSPAAPAANPQRASYANTPSAGSPSFNQPIKMEKGKAAVMGNGPKMVSGNGAKYELILQREDSEDDGTYGTLRFPDGTVLNTLELPWRNNEARISCIPPGQYECRKRPSVSFGAAYEVQKVPGRSAILIHAGNAAGSADKGMKANSQGCILLGMDRGRKGNQKVITASKAAMQLFHEKMADQPFTLIIRGGKNAVATGDKSVNLDAMRQPTVNAAVAPKQEITPQTSIPTASFKPQGPRSTATAAAPVATSTDLPRLNSTNTSLNVVPTKSDMQQRDAAVSSVIAPKIDGMANTLLQSLEVQTSGVGVLREILGALKGSTQPEKAPSAETGKLKPQTSTTVPVPQRRTF